MVRVSRGWWAAVLVAACAAGTPGAHAETEWNFEYLGAPIPARAATIGKGRYRVGWDWQYLKRQYQKVLRNRFDVKQRVIIDQPGIKAVYYENQNKGDRWAGINIYVLKDRMHLYVVPSDAEWAAMKVAGDLPDRGANKRDEIPRSQADKPPVEPKAP